MTRIQLPSRVTADGMVSVQLPPGAAKPNEDVLVTVESVRSEQCATSCDEEWKRFISETAGSISDPTFFRHEQGELEEPEEWG